MSKIKIVILFSLLLIVTLGARCGRDAGTAKNTGGDGGIFKSSDRGQTWFQSSKGEGEQGIEGLTVREILFDPQDYNTIFLTSPQGLWMSYDAAETWKRIANVDTAAVGIDYKMRGTLYLAAGSKLYKTTDVGKNWPEVYNETRKGVYFTDIALDPHDRSVIFAANSAGELMRSNDFGLSWNVVNSFGNEVRQIALDPSNQNVIYIATKEKGIFRSLDRGSTWVNLLNNYTQSAAGVDDKGRQKFVKRVDIEKFIKLVMDPTRPRRLYYLSRFGIVRSSNRGDNWEELPLMTVPGSVSIFDLKVNNRNNQELFYTAENVLYHSTNFGAEWFTETVPTNRKLRSLLINPDNPSIIYVGTELPPPSKKKKRGLFF